MNTPIASDTERAMEVLVVIAVMVLGMSCFLRWRFRTRTTLLAMLTRGALLSCLFVGVPYLVLHRAVIWWFSSDDAKLKWFNPFGSPTVYFIYFGMAIVVGMVPMIMYTVHREL